MTSPLLSTQQYHVLAERHKMVLCRATKQARINRICISASTYSVTLPSNLKMDIARIRTDELAVDSSPYFIQLSANTDEEPAINGPRAYRIILYRYVRAMNSLRTRPESGREGVWLGKWSRDVCLAARGGIVQAVESKEWWPVVKERLRGWAGEFVDEFEERWGERVERGDMRAWEFKRLFWIWLREHGEGQASV